MKLIFSRLAKSSNVVRLYVHLCRHTFAINYLLNGGDIFSLREILGHTTLDMVNHYLHFTSSQITAQHHKYSPMDKLQEVQEAKGEELILSTQDWDAKPKSGSVNSGTKGGENSIFDTLIRLDTLIRFNTLIIFKRWVRTDKNNHGGQDPA